MKSALLSASRLLGPPTITGSWEPPCVAPLPGSAQGMLDRRGLPPQPVPLLRRLPVGLAHTLVPALAPAFGQQPAEPASTQAAAPAALSHAGHAALLGALLATLLAQPLVML